MISRTIFHRAILALPALILIAAASPAATKEKAANPWVGAWGYAASPPTAKSDRTRPAGTFRYRIRLTQSGRGVALRFTTPENAVPLEIASVTVAPAAPSGFEAAADARPATFRRKPGATVEAGASLSTDPVALPVRAGQDILVTVQTSAPSTDVPGNAGFRAEYAPASGGAPETIASRPFISLVSVHNAQAPCTIVALGDSITEGARGKLAQWRGWPGRLAQRLIAASPDRHCGVVNMGISGNRLLAYGRGPSAIDRFGRDVLAVPGVTHVVVLEGINDIALSGAFRARKITAADLAAGYRKLIEDGHKRGLVMIGATLTPAWGSRFIDVDRERVRREANDWIRKPGNFDAVIDFEAALSDGTSPPALQEALDSGDKLHPGDAGFEAMANAATLPLFASSASSTKD